MVIVIVPLVVSAIVCQYRICIKNDVYDQGIDSDILQQQQEHHLQ